MNEICSNESRTEDLYSSRSPHTRLFWQNVSACLGKGLFMEIGVKEAPVMCAKEKCLPLGFEITSQVSLPNPFSSLSLHLGVSIGCERLMEV